MKTHQLNKLPTITQGWDKVCELRVLALYDSVNRFCWPRRDSVDQPGVSCSPPPGFFIPLSDPIFQKVDQSSHTVKTDFLNFNGHFLSRFHVESDSTCRTLPPLGRPPLQRVCPRPACHVWDSWGLGWSRTGPGRSGRPRLRPGVTRLSDWWA